MILQCRVVRDVVHDVVELSLRHWPLRKLLSYDVNDLGHHVALQCWNNLNKASFASGNRRKNNIALYILTIGIISTKAIILIANNKGIYGVVALANLTISAKLGKIANSDLQFQLHIKKI